MTPSQARVAEWYKAGTDLNRYMPENYYTVKDYQEESLAFGAVMLSRSYYPAKYPNVIKYDWMIVGKRGRIAKKSK